MKPTGSLFSYAYDITLTWVFVLLQKIEKQRKSNKSGAKLSSGSPPHPVDGNAHAE
jgi:hypothetical protein